MALKEWAVVCGLLAEGETALLLRKGGIHEDEGAGEFRMKHDRFALFPAWEHQKADWVKERWRGDAGAVEEPAEVELGVVAEVGRVWEVPSREALMRLDDLMVWTEPYFDMRFGYKSDHALYLVALRVKRLAEAKVVENDWTYGGCKSWVELREGDYVDEAGAKAVMGDVEFAGLLGRVDEVFGAGVRSAGEE